MPCSWREITVGFRPGVALYGWQEVCTGRARAASTVTSPISTTTFKILLSGGGRSNTAMWRYRPPTPPVPTPDVQRHRSVSSRSVVTVTRGVGSVALTGDGLSRMTWRALSWRPNTNATPFAGGASLLVSQYVFICMGKVWLICMGRYGPGCLWGMARNSSPGSRYPRTWPAIGH
jgi:hypothetical protein